MSLETSTSPHPNPLPEGEGTRTNTINWIIAAVLLIGTIALYARTAHHQFINFDDGDYVYENPRVRMGLSADNIGWAFTTGFASNWHPLTWLSLMLDVQIFGVNPGAIHIESAIMHAISSALLFWALLEMTGARWPSLWAAGMFAWHPLHVESVAWACERKDVLSAMFMMLALLAYVRYVRLCDSDAPLAAWRTDNAGLPDLRSRKRRAYIVLFTMLALGLLAKPMLVTFPFALLLLD